MITTLYHVSVTIPEEVWRAFGHTAEYEVKTLQATKGHVSAGSNNYSEVTEWAEFHTRFDAYTCEVLLQSMIEYFEGKLP